MSDELDGLLPTRRTALASAIGLAIVPGLARGDDGDDDREVEAVRDQARKAGLGPLRFVRKGQYLAIGDSPDAFRDRALELCLGLSKDYLKHFSDKGFRVVKPTSLMTLVVLSNRDAFSAYLGSDQGDVVGGVYEPETNRLVIFDNGALNANPRAQRANTFVLFHEATHQLTFSTGLLEREGDIPLAIVEGFGTYVEARGLNPRNKVGDVNYDRLEVLAPKGSGREKPKLASVTELIGDDLRLRDDETKQVAYSESWLLVHYLMRTPARLPQFRSYLEGIRGRRDPSHRLEDWTKSLGDPSKLDRELLAYLKKIR